MRTAPIDAAVHELTYVDLPAEVAHQARRCILDLVGTAAAGMQTDMSRIARNHAAEHLCAGAAGVPMMFDGRRVSAPGAAFAGAASIDSFDAHDGHALTKGHAGVAVLPAAFAVLDPLITANSQELITSIVVGYEVAIRAAMSLHASTAEYHSSGAWNAVGAAATAARLLNLDPTETQHALGLAEYHAPRSPMMRCIDHPSMVKDGSAAGSQTGVASALLARNGYTGAPAELLIPSASAEIWNDLGHRWRILECNFKPYPVIRWVHASLEAAQNLQLEHQIHAADIERIDVRTFAQAKRLTVTHPINAEEGQYSLAFPLACMLTNGRVSPSDVISPGSTHNGDAISRLAAHTFVHADEEFTRQFPRQRISEVRLTLVDGTTLHSGPTTAAGDPDRPLSDGQLSTKFLVNTEPALPHQRRSDLQAAVWGLGHHADLSTLVDLLLTQPTA